MDAPSPAPAGSMGAAVWILLALCCVVFGWMAIDHVFTLKAGEPSAWAQVQARLVSEAYSLGAGSTHLLQEAVGRPYRTSLVPISWHMAMGGVLLISGLLQFAPPLRRRWPRLHRATGALFIATCLLSIGSALWYLLRTPFELVYSGRPFAVGLTAQGLSVLSGLALAITAIRARDYASHMGWMALIFGVILSAPVLRVEWLLVGKLLPTMTQEQINLGVVATLNSFCMLPMAIRLATVGAREFRPRTPGLHMPPRLLHVLAAIGVFTVIHEGAMVPLGIDLLAGLRPETLRLPMSALLWSGAAVVALLLMPRAWKAAERGERMSATSALVALAVAAGAWMIAFTPAPESPTLVESVQPIVWGGYALVLMTLLALALTLRPQPGRYEPWGIQLLMMLLTPALWAGSALPLYLAGFSFEEALAGGMGLALGGGAIFGFALAFNLFVHLPGLTRQSASQPRSPEPQASTRR